MENMVNSLMENSDGWSYVYGVIKQIIVTKEREKEREGRREIGRK